MTKELTYVEDYSDIKYLDTTSRFGLALTEDGSAYDLSSAKKISIKIANNAGLVMEKDLNLSDIVDLTTGQVAFIMDDNLMKTLSPDTYYIEVWATLRPTKVAEVSGTSVIFNVANNGLKDQVAIFPSNGYLSFTIGDNLTDLTGNVIPVITLQQFQDTFDTLSSEMSDTIHNVKKGDKGDPGSGVKILGNVGTEDKLPTTGNEVGDDYLTDDGHLHAWVGDKFIDVGEIHGPQGLQGIQGKTGVGVSSTTIQYQISNSATTTPTGTWSNSLIATTQDNPFLWTQVTLNYDDRTSKSFYLVSSKGDKGDKGDTGATGPIGPQGPVGAGLVVKGTVSNASQLPTTGNQEGYCYFIGTDLYVWDAGAWKNCGSVSPDLSNYVTVTDLNNGLSTKVTDNHDGTITANNLTYDLSKSGLTPISASYSGSYNDLPLGTVFATSKMTGGPDTIHAFTTTTFYFNGCNPGRKAQIAIADSTNLMYLRVYGGVSWTSWVLLSDDSKVVHSTDMRKPASDVAGIEEVNSKQDKLSYTPADDSKVVHSTVTQLNSTDMNTVRTAGFYQLNSGTNGMPNADTWTLYQVIPLSKFNGVQLAYGTNNSISGMRSWNNYNHFTSWVKFADDSKVAHLSGANNFDTVPTVNNNPLLLASSLPSDIARTTKDTNFTGKLQKSGIDVATKSDVTTAISTATANMVDSTKATNFTAGLQSGGLDVATAADIKSIEDKAWYQLDNKYIVPASGYTLAPSTSILYKIDDSIHTVYLSGTIAINASNQSRVRIVVDLSSIFKNMKTYSVPYLGYTDDIENWKFTSAGQMDNYLTFLTVAGIVSIAATSGTNGHLALVTYDELV